ncbi:protein Flattop [Antennarius striatus]|uniref:protein Flattop n=1 Tax=Antennarius striatus TaxID=241820 RepID=UPI0035B199AB
MSSNYSANQFDSAFRSQKLQNWCEARHSKQRPTAKSGHTKFIVNDRGHILPQELKRDRSWSDFKGTWDLTVRIPVHKINSTGRSVEGLNRLKSWGFDPQATGKSQPHGVIKDANTNSLLEVADQDHGNIHKDGADEKQPDSQNISVTEDMQMIYKDKDFQPAVVGFIDQPAQ